jgi:hypothetical protein
MTQHQIFGAVSISLCALATWIYIVTQVQPNPHDVQIMATFFLTMLIWVGSLLASVICITRIRRSNREVIYAHVIPSVRQGFIISATLTLILFLQYLRVLSWWDALLVIVGAFLFEIAFRHPLGSTVTKNRGKQL